MAVIVCQLLTAMRNPADLSDPIGPKWLEEFVRDITALGGRRGTDVIDPRRRRLSDFAA